MLKGTGTRASKSRLTTFADARESSHTTFRVDKHERMTRSSSGSCFGKQKSKVKRDEEDRGLMGASVLSSSSSFCRVRWFLSGDDVVGVYWRREKRRRGEADAGCVLRVAAQGGSLGSFGLRLRWLQC